VICQKNQLKMHAAVARILGTRQAGRALRHVEGARRLAATCSSSVVAVMAWHGALPPWPARRAQGLTAKSTHVSCVIPIDEFHGAEIDSRRRRRPSSSAMPTARSHGSALLHF